MNLRSKTFTAEFSSKYNNFTSIKNIISNDEYIKKEVNVPIITLYGTVDNIKSELIPQEGKIQGNENELTIEYISTYELTLTSSSRNSSLRLT